MTTPAHRGPCVVVAGGGTAGHIEPAMALADAVRRIRPDVRVVALGTERGLEKNIIPARGYQLEMIPPVPMPRKPNVDLLKLPLKVRAAIKQTRDVLDRVGADVVVGFGGYVALPAYLAARGRVPIVVHDSNARVGLANKVGARFAARVAVATADSGLPNAEVIGIPLRGSIIGLDRPRLRLQGRQFFGLHPTAPTLLVTGGSQGARSINNAVSACARVFADRGIGVLHAYGQKNAVAVQEVPGRPRYVSVPYLERMDLAYASADAILCRCGAMTVAEVSAVGLPAIYVPLPIGNGEQALNAKPMVDAGAALMIKDDELTPERAADAVVPLLTDPLRLRAMSAAAHGGGHREAADVLARMVLEVIGK